MAPALRPWGALRYLGRLTVLAGAVLALGGCGKDGSTGPTVGPPARMVVAAGDSQAAKVGTELANPVVVKVLDAQGRPVAGQLVNFRITSGGGSFYAGSGLTNAQGLVQDRWTLGTAVGRQTAEARAVDPNTGAALLFASFTATARADDAATVEVVSGDAQQARVGSVLPESLTVRVKDRFGNPVPGVSVNWAVTAGGGTLAPTQSLTSDQGIARAAWTLGPRVGANAATATVGGLPAVTFGATGIVGPAAQLAIQSGNAQTAARSSVLPAPLVVRVIDALGNPVQGAVVSWAVMSGGGSVSPPSATTDATGVARTTWTLGAVVGQQTVSAAVAGIAPVTFTANATAVTIVGLASGGDMTCALTNAGAVYCWGHFNFYAQPTTAALVPGGIAFSSVSVGYAHACFLTAAGKAYCWGLNDYAQLGTGTQTSYASPVPVATDLTFSSLSAGALFTCGLTTGRVAYCWGIDDYGQLGTQPPQTCYFAFNNSPFPCSTTPVRVASPLTFTALGAQSGACAVATSGGTYCWGDNEEGELGIGPTSVPTASQCNGDSTRACAPLQVVGGQSFAGVWEGNFYACALTPAGAAYCWGADNGAQLGTPPPTTCGPNILCSNAPVPVSGGRTFSSLVTGNGVNCGLSAGVTYCWGGNSDGQLGIGTLTTGTTCFGSPCSYVPLAVQTNLSFTLLAAGDAHACGAATDGNVYCWGNNQRGQIGDGTQTRRLVPTKVQGLP